VNLPVVIGIVIVGLIVFVSVIAKRTRIVTSETHLAGPTAAVPMSSGALNAELLRRAMEKLSAQDAKNVCGILESVHRERYAEALRTISDVLLLQHDPDVQTLLLWTKSNIYQRSKQVLEEIDVLEQVSALRPHALFELNLAIAHSKLDRYAEAEAHYQRAIDLMGGRYPLAVYNLGILYCVVGVRTKAAEQLNILRGFGTDVPNDLITKLSRRVSDLG